MLTLFSIPKPFRGHIGLIQRNAIQSWTQLRPVCEVILFGDEEGTADVAAEYKLSHVPMVARNSFGAPLVSDLFARAQRLAACPHLCYVNADILLLDDFIPGAQAVASELYRFLLVGRRWDLDVREPMEFALGWENTLRKKVATSGVLHPHTGIDYFVFPRGIWDSIPPFAIGRPAYDGWLICSARSRKIPVVDATERVTVVHQNHDYSLHRWKGPEVERNLKLAGGYRHAFTLRDATHQLTPHGLKARQFPYDLWRCLVTPVVTHPSMKGVVRWVKSAVQLEAGENGIPE